MEKSKKEIVNKLLKQEITKEEESELLDLLVDKPIAVDVEKQEESNLTFGEKLADKLSAIAGSWTFILIFGLFGAPKMGIKGAALATLIARIVEFIIVDGIVYIKVDVLKLNLQTIT